MPTLPRLKPLASILTIAAIAVATLAQRCVAAPIVVPVLVVATYETGKDRGDTPGELQYWAERQDLKDPITVPGVDHAVLTNGKGLYAMVCGTTSRCAVQIMALAADPRFDLTHTYIIMGGIGGGFPKVMSLGSAVWVQRVLDGNPAFEIDSREIPADWSSGLVAIGAKRPGEGSANVDSVPDAGISDNASEGIGSVAFKLNPSLVKWAYELTKDVQIPDSEPLRSFGRTFKGYPVARQPPAVIMGDSIGSDRFFHGEVMARWAEDWDRIYTRGQGRLAISDCEDAGACIAFHRLAKMGKIDFNRILVLRTACNFTVPPTGVTAEKSLFGDTVSDSSGVAYITALEADYRVGIVVVEKLLADPAKYRDEIP
ncbi:MAG TPA: purine nucleoside permease [Opitutaceae bacterium]|jgi:purine nucleoside permease|nr:purine nucleoside permease [Opitutaceae bacterium]